MKEKSSRQLPQNPVPFLPQDPVPYRIVIPAKVAFDLGNFQKVIENFAREIGCERCFSGRSCLFTLERDFIVDPATLEVRGLGGR
jgi:hypothetical protein